VHRGTARLPSIASCKQLRCELDEIGDDPGRGKRPPAPIDEGRAPAESLGADATEGVVGDKQDAVRSTAMLSAARA